MNDNPFIDDSGSRYFELELNTQNVNECELGKVK